MLSFEGTHAPSPRGASLKSDSILSIHQNHLGWKWLKRNPWKNLKVIIWDDFFQSSFSMTEKGCEELSKVQGLKEFQISTNFNKRHKFNKKTRGTIFEGQDKNGKCL